MSRKLEYNNKIQSLDLVVSNVEIAKDTFEMVLKSETTSSILPGQFINIKIAGQMLRRPLSVASVEQGQYRIIYKVVGAGTEVLSRIKSFTEVDVLKPLGNPFPLENLKEVLIIGGGVGVPPLYEVAKQFCGLKTQVTVILGFNDRESIFYETEFKKLGCHVYVATMDGSYGTKGTVLTVVKEKNISIDTVYACGPLPMLVALNKTYQKGYLSLESRMACGIGACMACVCLDSQDSKKYYRICKEGPVFPFGQVEITC